MNFQSNSAGDNNEPTLNVAPLMDVMFLLVIFFAVSTTFRVYPGISVNLPAAKAETIREEEKTLTAILTEEGEIFLDGEEVARGQVPGFLKRRQQQSPVSIFVLQADDKARHGLVVELMDAAKQCGILRLAIATRQKALDVDKESRPLESEVPAPIKERPLKKLE